MPRVAKKKVYKEYTDIKEYLKKDKKQKADVKELLLHDLLSAGFIKLKVDKLVDYYDGSQDLTITFSHDGQHRVAEKADLSYLTKHFKAFQPGGILYKEPTT